MRIAITVWNGEVATVADFARHLLLVEEKDGQAPFRSERDAPGDDPACWCARLAAEGVTTLLCGAITRHLEDRLLAAGITVVDGCSGAVEVVLAAWWAGTIDAVRGHAPCRRRWRGGRGHAPPCPARLPATSSSQVPPMRIAIPIQGTTLADPIDPRFGRAHRFLVVDAATNACTTHDNPHGGDAAHGAGLRTAGFVANLGVTTVVGGAIGPKAMEVLRQAGIQAFLHSSGSAAEALALLAKHQLAEAP